MPETSSSSSPAARELNRRVRRHLPQTRLLVDYYRIRRRAAFPLPVTGPWPLPEAMPLRFISDMRYPWGIWMAWALEERLQVLGQAAGQPGADPAIARVAARELDALADWPCYHQLEGPDLMPAHLSRVLHDALFCWKWVEDPLREKLGAAAARLAEARMDVIAGHFGERVTRQSLLDDADTERWLHNIPLIDALSAGQLANALGLPGAGEWNEKLFAWTGALLDYRRTGFSEALAYDGYVLDFMTGWLAGLPLLAARPLLGHPRLEDAFEQSCYLSAPGAVHQAAELGDVEPRRMPFHLAAQVKLQKLRPDPHRAWFIGQLPLEWLPADALGILLEAVTGSSDQGLLPRVPPSGALDAHYARVLRSGYGAEDLAVAVGASTARMGHIHADAGSMVLGTHGRWLIGDPGYQQYLQTREREYTLGKGAHNHPVINGCPASLKRPRVLAHEGAATASRLELDLTACYPPEAGVTRARRTVRLQARETVEVEDAVQAAGDGTLAFHWHGHPEAGWWFQDGRAHLYCEDLPGLELQVTCSAGPLDESMLYRLPGSRGSLTLVFETPAPVAAVTWTFRLA